MRETIKVYVFSLFASIYNLADFTMLNQLLQAVLTFTVILYTIVKIHCRIKDSKKQKEDEENS